MARFIDLDLDDSEDDASHDAPDAYARRIIAAAHTPSQTVQQANDKNQLGESDRNDTRKVSFAAALTCFPYATIHAIY